MDSYFLNVRFRLSYGIAAGRGGDGRRPPSMGRRRAGRTAARARARAESQESVGSRRSRRRPVDGRGRPEALHPPARRAARRAPQAADRADRDVDGAGTARARAPRNRPTASQTRPRWTVVVRLDWIGWIGLVGWLVGFLDGFCGSSLVGRSTTVDRSTSFLHPFPVCAAEAVLGCGRNPRVQRYGQSGRMRWEPESESRHRSEDPSQPAPDEPAGLSLASPAGERASQPARG